MCRSTIPIIGNIVSSSTAKSPLDQAVIDKSLAEVDEHYRPVRNQSNHFMQDRAVDADADFTGMGSGFQTHDAFATGSQGAMQDRTQENIVSSDIAIVAARKLMEKAIRDIQAGGEPPHVMRKPEQNNLSHLLVISDLVSGVSDWKGYTRAMEAGSAGRNRVTVTCEQKNCAVCCRLLQTPASAAFSQVLKFGYPALAALAL